MLSSAPAVPIHSINWSDDNRRRLSLVTAHGRELGIPHEGLPSPEHLTPISGGQTPVGGHTPATGHSPPGSEGGSAPASRRGSEKNGGVPSHIDLTDRLHRVPSRAHLGDEVSLALIRSCAAVVARDIWSLLR